MKAYIKYGRDNEKGERTAYALALIFLRVGTHRVEGIRNVVHFVMHDGHYPDLVERVKNANSLGLKLELGHF